MRFTRRQILQSAAALSLLPIAARATRREQDIQRRIRKHAAGDSPVEEAEALIGEVLQRDDPFEQGEILREIDGELNNTTIADDLADAGFGPRSRSTAADVLSRLQSKS